MKLAVTIVALMAACSVNTRSEGFECNGDFECGSNRICERNWCVLGQRDSGVVEVDAPPEIDANNCPPGCTTCSATECTIDCDDDECADLVCPAGLNCVVNCTGDNSCTGDIDCSGADECRIECSGDSSCDATISCPTGSGDCRVDCEGNDSCAQLISSGAGDTDINCDGTSSCAAGVDCQAACACDVDCAGAMCPMMSMCPPEVVDVCETAEGGCQTIGTCDSC